MTSFSDVFEQFLVRDLLGYILPGCVAATALAFCAPVEDVDHLVVTASLAKLTFASVVVFYLCGLTCSAVGDLVGEIWGWLVALGKTLWRLVTRPKVKSDASGNPVAPGARGNPKDADAVIVEDVVASGVRVSRRYVARIQDLGLSSCNGGVALLAVVAAKLQFAHQSFAAALGHGPFACAYRCMTGPVIVAMVSAAIVLLWSGLLCFRDATRRTTAIAAKIAEARRVTRGSGTPPIKRE